MNLKRLVTVGAAALVVAGCGVRPMPGVVATSPPAAVTPGVGFDVVITEQDHEVTVHPGQKIEAFLRPRAGMTPWGNLGSDNPAVLASIPTGILAPHGVSVAGFQAISAGVAYFTATAGPECSPDQACPAYAMLLSVKVTVI